MSLHLYSPKGVSLFMAEEEEKKYEMGDEDEMYASLMIHLWDFMADLAQKGRSQDKAKVSSATLRMRQFQTDITIGNR